MEFFFFAVLVTEDLRRKPEPFLSNSDKRKMTDFIIKRIIKICTK